MGKTGTAQLITNGRYDPRRHIFSFMAIVEKGDYKRVIVVNIKETTKKGYLATRVAVPLFERVAHKMLIHDKIICDIFIGLNYLPNSIAIRNASSPSR